MKMSYLRPAFSLLLLSCFLLLCGCQEKKGEEVAEVQENLVAANVEAYQDVVAQAIELNFAEFKEQCRDIKDKEISNLNVTPLTRTGPVLIAKAKNWEPTSPDSPSYEYELLPGTESEQPSCVAIVYESKLIVGTSSKKAESAFSKGGKVKLSQQVDLVYLVDLNQGLYLGTGYAIGGKPSSEQPNGTAPKLAPILGGPVFDAQSVLEKVEELSLAWKSGDETKTKELLAALPATEEAGYDFFLSWSREATTAGVPEQVEIVLENLSSKEDGGLEYTVQMTGPWDKKDKNPAFYLRLYFDQDNKLQRVENIANSSETKLLIDKLLEVEPLKGETPRTVLELAEECSEQNWNRRSLKLISQLKSKKFGELSKEQGQRLAQMEKSILKDRAKKFAPEIEKLKAEALAYLKTNTPGKAIKSLNQAAKLDPTDDEVAFFLIRSYDESNRLATAEKLAKEFGAKFPNSEYAERIGDVRKELAKKKTRLEVGKDVSAHYKVIGKPIIEVDSYSSRFYPADTDVLDRHAYDAIKKGTRARRYRYGVPRLKRGDKLKVLKAASFTKQGRSYYRRYRRGRHSYKRGRSDTFDAVYVEALSGEAKGTKGWIQLSLVDYQDIGYASEPFAFPLIFEEDATRLGSRR